MIQMEAIEFIILQIFFTAYMVLKIEEYHSNILSFSWRIFSYVTHLSQSIFGRL